MKEVFSHKGIIKRSKNKNKQSLYAKIDWEKTKELFKQPYNSPKESKLFPTTREILHILAAAGAIGLTFAFPKAGAEIGRFLLGDDSRSFPFTLTTIGTLSITGKRLHLPISMFQ